MKNLKYIRQDFHSIARVMPPWVGLVWGSGGKKKCFAEIQQNLMCELLTWMAHATSQFLGSPSPGITGRGHISLNFNYKVNCKDFKTILCVSSHK